MKPLPSLTRRVIQFFSAGLSVGFGRAGLVFATDDYRGMAMAAVAHLLLLQVVLKEVAAVVHGLGGLDLEADSVGEFVDFSEDLFEFFAAEEVAELTAADRNEEENVPHDDVELFEQGAEIVEVVRVVAADGGVDLDGKAGFAGPFDGLDGARPCAGKSAECVVDLRAMSRRARCRGGRHRLLSS